MLYIYDILLNWCKDKLYDFFEWEKTDKLDHIKKIPLFRVERGIVNKFINKNIKISESFVSRVYNLTEVYTSKKVDKVPYAFLLTDGLMVLAIKTDKQGLVKYRSKLIIDEEEEILCISNKLDKVNIDYIEKGYIYKDDFSTRQERCIREFLLKEVENSYNNKDYAKLKYLYTEYSGSSKEDMDLIYKELTNSINLEINENHHKLYSLLQLTTNKN